MTEEGCLEIRTSPADGLRFVVALKPEADPVIVHFEMKPVAAKGPFRCWADEAGRHWLVVSGIGKTSAAAAAAWLYAISGAGPAAAWINLGIAGHPVLPPESIRRIHKITDASSGRSWFPPLVIGADSKIQSESLITVDRPAKEFPDDHSLVDMEASGFAESAARITTLELVQCVKIVSDNAETGFEDLKGNRGQISRLVSDLVAELSDSGFFEALEDASATEADRTASPPEYEDLIGRVHFTESQKHQLKRLLRRSAALGIGPTVIPESDSRTILRGLEAGLAQALSTASKA